MLNINVDHIAKEKFDGTRQLLDCGCGTETIVISQNGKMRICPVLPEENFDMGGMESFRKQIEEGFLEKEFCKCVRSYLDKGDVPEKINTCDFVKRFSNITNENE